MVLTGNEKKKLYRLLLSIAIPIMIQNGITNFVGLLDNIMVGQLGTDAMSATAIVNQLLFVWNLCIFGGTAGIGIFTAQFFGKGDEEGVRYTLRLEIIGVIILTIIGAATFLIWKEDLIGIFLKGENGSGSTELTMQYAKEYMNILLCGLIAFALSQGYSTVLRSCGESRIPMNASLIAVVVNLAGNYILIYGKFGLPKLGTSGAAYATVLSRVVEFLYIVIWIHTNSEKYPYIRGALASFYVPRNLILRCLKKTIPLLINETLWAAGQAVLAQSYSLRGLDVVAAYNISSTASNLFNVSFIAFGSSIGIILGQKMGVEEKERIKKETSAIILFAILICCGVAAVLGLISGYIPYLYHVSNEVRSIAASLILVCAICLPINAYVNASYFTIRSGGNTFVTFLFDSIFTLAVTVPLVVILARMTAVSIIVLFFAAQSVEIIKCLIGFLLIRNGFWINDLTQYEK